MAEASRKVVLFCGGLGLRMRELSEEIPKPMLQIGDRPILWHIMKWYASYGHKEFILCLGYQSEVIKNYFLRYQNAAATDFQLTPDKGRHLITSQSSEIDGWTITFVDTGLHSSIAERLLKVRPLLNPNEPFFANYGDNLTNVDLTRMYDAFDRNKQHVASFLCVRPNNLSFHVVKLSETRESAYQFGGEITDPTITTYVVDGIEAIHSNSWINGGYFIFRPAIFDTLAALDFKQEPVADLVPDAFNLLIRKKQLYPWVHGNSKEDFWRPMDTPKDMRLLGELYTSGKAKWVRW